jgi:hypothetical protein
MNEAESRAIVRSLSGMVGTGSERSRVREPAAVFEPNDRL